MPSNQVWYITACHSPTREWTTSPCLTAYRLDVLITPLLCTQQQIHSPSQNCHLVPVLVINTKIYQCLYFRSRNFVLQTLRLYFGSIVSLLCMREVRLSWQAILIVTNYYICFSFKTPMQHTRVDPQLVIPNSTMRQVLTQYRHSLTL